MQIIKPPHKFYVFRQLDNATYNNFAREYSKAKRLGARGIVAWTTGAGVKEIILESCKGTVRMWGREKIGSGLLCYCAYLSSPLTVFVTNSTRILKTAKNIHTCAAFILECGEDTMNLSFLALDICLFGRPIPIGERSRFNFFNKTFDFLDE